MGLLISQPSVFLWGPEACLSTVSVVFVGRRALYTKENHIGGSVNYYDTNTRAGTDVSFDWLMRSELGYFACSLVSGFIDDAAPLRFLPCILS